MRTQPLTVLQRIAVEQLNTPAAVRARIVFGADAVQVLVNEKLFGTFPSVTAAEYAVVGRYGDRVISWEGL